MSNFPFDFWFFLVTIRCMLKIFQYFIFLIAPLFSLGTVFAWEIPFTDVKTTDSYYESVRELYESRIVSDNGDHLFRPQDLMSRDFFVSLAVEIGCHQCETPSMDDIITYQISPFIDLPKTNQYYYCIAYAKDNNITQWYITDTTGTATCENAEKYMSSPFCAANSISRIESAAILLRRARLWDDTLNSGNFDKGMSIPDVTPYWYGYAKKWIEIGIIKQKSDNSIGQDEKITRGEFANMAARILRYTQCQTDTLTNTIEAEIGVRDTNKKLIQKSNFSSWEIFSLVPITSTGSWNYNWIVKNPNTGETLQYSGSTLPSSKLIPGTWVINLQVIDPIKNTIISEPTSTIRIWVTDVYAGNIAIKDSNGTISNNSAFSTNESITLISTHTGWPWSQTWQAVDKKTGNTITGIGKELAGSRLGEWNWTITLLTNDPTTGTTVDTDIRDIRIIPSTIPLVNNTNSTITLTLHADQLVTNLWSKLNFTSNTNATGSLVYKWDFWDGSMSTWSGSSSHIYNEWWVYTVTLTVIDPKTWSTSQSSVIVRIAWERDSDGDMKPDTIDQCPLVYAISITGCPIVPVYSSQSTTLPVITNPLQSGIDAAIWIKNSAGTIISNNNFAKGESFSLVPVTGNGNWNYSWNATNQVTGQVVTGNGWVFPSSVFSSTGDWKVILNVIDPVNGATIASPSITIRIQDPANSNTGTNPCVSIIATPMSTVVNSTITMTPTVCTSMNPLTYTWNYGDGSTWNGAGATNHTYTTPGVYNVTLTITDSVTGKTGTSVVLVKIEAASSFSTLNSDTSAIGNNVCLEVHRKTQWLLIGQPNCTQCPCTNSISINAPLRSCDVVFPTILSPKKDMIYARGWFYLIP